DRRIVRGQTQAQVRTVRPGVAPGDRDEAVFEVLDGEHWRPFRDGLRDRRSLLVLRRVAGGRRGARFLFDPCRSRPAGEGGQGVTRTLPWEKRHFRPVTDTEFAKNTEKMRNGESGLSVAAPIRPGRWGSRRATLAPTEDPGRPRTGGPA